MSLPRAPLISHYTNSKTVPVAPETIAEFFELMLTGATFRESCAQLNVSYMAMNNLKYTDAEFARVLAEIEEIRLDMVEDGAMKLALKNVQGMIFVLCNLRKNKFKPLAAMQKIEVVPAAISITENVMVNDKPCRVQDANPSQTEDQDDGA